MPTSNDRATFPTLSRRGNCDLLRPLARCQDMADGEVAFRAGDADIDLFVVQSGGLRTSSTPPTATGSSPRTGPARSRGTSTCSPVAR